MEKKQEKKQDQNKVEKRDPFFNLKYLAYCMSQQPAKRSDVDLSDFIRFARYSICSERGIAFWDPVWDTYTDEQIIIEYYAILLDKDATFREEFESKLNSTLGLADEDVDWMDKMIAENQKEREAMAEKQAEADFDFKPDSLGE